LKQNKSPFKWRHFEPTIILLCVRWYLSRRRILSDSDFDRPDGAALYSERLLGLRGECSVCSGVENSTGWLLKREGGDPHWYVDLQCEGCGSRGGTWNREWVPLIEEVLGAAGRDSG
jgi:hypothetical protein